MLLFFERHEDGSYTADHPLFDDPIELRQDQHGWCYDVPDWADEDAIPNPRIAAWRAMGRVLDQLCVAFEDDSAELERGIIDQINGHFSKQTG